MATSGVTAWSLTARDIITAALEENAIIRLGKSPTAPEATACLSRLNALLKSLPVGRHLEQEYTVTVPAATASVVLDEDVREVIRANYVQSASFQRLLARWERDDYFDLSNKAAAGEPVAFYAAKELNQFRLYVWPVKATEATLKVDCLRTPETVTDLGQTVDWPEEYQEALYANLAVRCAGIFGVDPRPELVARSQVLRREMEDAERPASYFMGAW